MVLRQISGSWMWLKTGIDFALKLELKEEKTRSQESEEPHA
jgi:hypothetical protein